jgi:DNA invertase Pin-like site-specific DNA recombinase
MPRQGQGDSRLAVAYLRVSTDTDRQALGTQAQRDAIQRWAQGTGTIIVQSFVEEVSGGAALDRRPILLEALGAVAAYGAGLLVVQRLDRFSRDPLTAALAEAELQRHGATLAVADGAGSGEDATAALIRSILFAVSRFEKEMIRARIKAALAVKRARGERLGGAPPYGFRVEGKSLVPHEDEAAVKDQLRQWRAQGLTLRALQERAMKEGLVSRAGKPFTLSAIHALVKEEEAA